MGANWVCLNQLQAAHFLIFINGRLGIDSITSNANLDHQDSPPPILKLFDPDSAMLPRDLHLESNGVEADLPSEVFAFLQHVI